MIASTAMLLDFIATANAAVVNAIIPDAAADTTIASVYSIDYGYRDPKRRLKRKRDLLTRQAEAAIRRGTQTWVLNRYRRIERDMNAALIHPPKKARK